MTREIKLGKHLVGDGYPAFIVAEIGINHNGNLAVAKQMIDAAVHAGADAVKFQKRTPEIATPREQQKQMRETPWGYITYLDYRQKVEFGEAEYQEIDQYCREKSIPWLVSVWDEQAVDFMERFDTPAYKIPSASLTDHNLLVCATASTPLRLALNGYLIDGHVHHATDPRRCQCDWDEGPSDHALHQHLPMRAGGT